MKAARRHCAAEKVSAQHWALVRVLGILDSELVQVELPLDPFEQLATGLEEADPYEGAVLIGPISPLPRW